MISGTGRKVPVDFRRAVAPGATNTPRVPYPDVEASVRAVKMQPSCAEKVYGASYDAAKLCDREREDTDEFDKFIAVLASPSRLIEIQTTHGRESAKHRLFLEHRAVL